MLKRRWFILAVWGILIAATLGFSPPRQDSREIKLEIQAGYDGYYRAGKWLPVQVTIQNTDRDLRGALRVRTQDVGDNAEALYQTPVTVARNSSKTVFIYISLESQKPDIQVELLDNDGRVIKSEAERLTQINSRDILYVVITESIQGTVDVTRRALGSGKRYQVNWKTRDLPVQPEALRAVDVIIFFDVRNSRLTTEQQEALEVWVNGGGHLIIHGGPNWQYASSILSRLLPTDPTGIETVAALTALGEFLGRPSTVLASTESGPGYIVTRNTPREEAEVLLAIENIPIIARQHWGSGLVDYVALDPLTAPLKDYPDTDSIWFALTASAEPRPSWAYDFQDWTSANNAIRVVTGVNLPSALQMLGFLAIYIVLIGPLNYIILNQLRRRELAWITIPLLIVLFTVVAYFTGFSLRGSAATVNHLSVVQVWANSDIARVDGLVGVFSPRRTTYDMTISSNMTLRTIPGVKDVDTGIAQIPIIEDSNFHIENLPVDAGIIASFATSGYTPAPHISGHATWKLNDTESPRLSGTITNTENFVLEDVVILAKDGFLPIGTIAPGESRKFDFVGDYRLQLQEPTWLPLGNRSEPLLYSPYRTFSGRPSRDRTRNIVYMQTPFDCSAGGYNATMVQVLYGQEYDCYQHGGSDDERAARRRALLLAAINNEFDYSGGRSGNVYVVGWAETAPFEVKLEGTDQRNRHETLYIFELSTTFELDPAINGDIMIPPGLMTWTLVDTSGFTIDRTPYNLQLIGPDQFVFRFAPVGPLQTRKVNTLELRVEISTGGFRQISLALWDWQTGAWVVQEPGDIPFRLIIDNPAPYLGPHNTVLVQIQPAENIDEVYVQLLEPVMYIR